MLTGMQFSSFFIKLLLWKDYLDFFFKFIEQSRRLLNQLVYSLEAEQVNWISSRELWNRQ